MLAILPPPSPAPFGSLLARPAAAAHDAIRAARPELAPGSRTFQAAVVLLAAQGAALNIDRIARQTGCPRNVVAAFARRLYDNGVWAAGRTEYAWQSPSDPRFWDDAGVAEGRICRRAADDGRLEWAPAGVWRKAYDYVDCAAAGGPAVRYLADEEPRAELPAAAPAEEPAPPPPAAPEPRFATTPRPALQAAFAGRGSSLFPDAVWLA